MKADGYTYRVTQSVEDRQYVGLCAEFPSLSWLATTPVASSHGIRRLVASVLLDMKLNDEPLPIPPTIARLSD
jgi:hypothetical protein